MVKDENNTGTTVETLLNRCFFIYDKTASNREEDDPKDKIVFFYPSEVRVSDVDVAAVNASYRSLSNRKSSWSAHAQP